MGQHSPTDLSILKAQVGKLGRAIDEAAVQSHGGIDMTDELPIGHYLKRLLTLSITHIFSCCYWPFFRIWVIAEEIKQRGGIHRSASMDSNREWVEREGVDCQFKDERLGKRFRSLLSQLSSSPGDSIALVCQDWANTKAAYRFLDNERVSEAEILGGHFLATRDRVCATDGPILVMHDTTEFTYKREDIEAVGKTRINIAGAYPCVPI